MQLDYFVYTSGEEIDRNIDWGVKFASPELGERQKLKERYESLLTRYSLSASLREHEDSKEYRGLFLLRKDDVFYIGYVFPGRDREKRINTSIVVCKIPREHVSGKSVSDVVDSIWSSNDLRRIASHEGERPEQLDYNEASVKDLEIEYQFHRSVDWVEEGLGFTQINGVLKKHKAVPVQETEKPEGGPDGPKTTKPDRTQLSPKILVGICVVALAAVVGVSALLMFGTDRAPNNGSQDVTVLAQPMLSDKSDEKPIRDSVSPNINAKVDLGAIKERFIEYLDHRRPYIGEKVRAFQTRLREGNTFEQMKRAIGALPGGREVLAKVAEDRDGEHVRFSFGSNVSEDDLFLHKRQKDWYLNDCLDEYLRQFSSNSNR